MRIRTSMLTTCALLGIALIAPSARADGLGGISGWQPVPNTCGGPASIFPVLVTNATNVPQTGSITIGPGLTAQVEVFDTYQQALQSPFGVFVNSGGACPGRPELESEPQFQQNFPVGPGQVQTWWMAVGGMDYNLIDDTHNIAIGGLPSGTAGASWYDFNVTLGMDEQFKNIQLQYQSTGGINTDNNQNGFNVVACQTTANGTLVPTTTVLSPYSTHIPPFVQYGFGQPICLGWLPTGTMLAPSTANILTGEVVASITAIQFNPTGNLLNIQGTLQPNITNLDVGAGSVWLTNTLGASGGSFIANGTDFVIEGVPLTCDQVDVVFAGTANGYTPVNDTLEIAPIPTMPACPAFG